MERITQYRNTSQLSHATTKSPSLCEYNSMFPSDEEISSFLHAISDTEHIKGLWRKFREGSNSRNGKIHKETFVKVMKHYFDLPNESIPIQLFRSEFYLGFGVRKYLDKGTTEVLDNEIELHDIILALTLISRISDDLKIWSKNYSVVFELTDVDEDGCLSPEEIAKMIEVIERIFAKENGDIELKSRVLMESLSREKAKRRYDWAMKSVGNLEAKCMREDGLVTYKEFYETICMMPKLKKQFLPRYLDFKTILTNTSPEPEILISDLNRDDFVMFRYEMHALLSKGLQPNCKGVVPIKKIDAINLDRSEALKNVGNSILAGPTPNRSKMKQVNSSHKECPGLIKVKSYSIGSRETRLPNGVWEYNSNVSQGYVRKTGRIDEIEVEIREKNEMIKRIVPKREAEIAMEELEHLLQGEDFKYLSKQDEAFELDTGEMVSKNLKKRRNIEEYKPLHRTMPKNYYDLLR